MWPKIFLTALVAFLTGSLALLAFKTLAPDAPPIAGLLSAALMGGSGIALVVSGLALALTQMQRQYPTLRFARRRKFALWHNIFTSACLVFFVAMIIFALRGFLPDAWSSAVVPVGLALAFSGGGAGIVSGLTLALAPGAIEDVGATADADRHSLK